MRTVLAWAALSALLASVVADYNITVSNVPDATRSSWCSAEYTACTTLCGGTTLNNTCDPTTLIYSCSCNNGSAPGLQYYENTMPWYLCQEAYAECIKKNSNDLTGQQNCKNTIQNNCGTLNLTDFSSASPSSSGSASAGAATGSATAHSPGATSTSHSGASPTKKAAYLGNAVAAVAAAVLAAALL